MKRHAFTATRGARYSRHLGIRYSNNDVTPTVTWYTDAHEKLYRKNKGSSAIYYHVKNADGSLQGWIWRGYLKKINTNTSNASTSTPATTNYDTIAKNAIIGMGHGASPDTTSMSLAKNVLTQAISEKYHFLTQAESDPNNPNLKNDNSIVIHDVSFKDLESKNDKLMYDLLTRNGIGDTGMGNGKATTGLFIANKLDFSSTLIGTFGPSSEFYVQQGLTSKNYFTDVKIGVAVTKTSKGQWAMFAILKYPNKYSQLSYNE